MVFAKSTRKDIQCFMYTFSNYLTAIGVRNALRSRESSIQVQISLHAALLNTLTLSHPPEK